MRISPDERLLRAFAAWTGAAVLVLLLPALWPALIGALVLLGVLAAWDAMWLGRDLPILVERRIPERVFVGREAEVALVVFNPAQRPVETIVLDELPSDLAASEPRFTGVIVPPGGSTTLHYRIRPSLRGDRRFGPMIVLARSPLGFLRRRTMAGAGEIVRVYPDATRYLRPEALDPRRVFASLGVRPERARGEGMEFESLRDYVQGDDPRRVDWAASARRGRPVVRLYQHERNHTVMIALDASRLMGTRIGSRTKLDYAMDAALALAYAALASGDRLGMAVFDKSVRAHLAPRAQRGGLGSFVDLLRTVHPQLVEANYQELARHLGTRQRHRALVVILTDFVEADPRALCEPLVIMARRHRVLLVTVRDRMYGALDPAASGLDEPPTAMYRRLVLNDLLGERETTLTALRRQGLQTLDLLPEAITASVLNRYLALRYGHER